MNNQQTIKVIVSPIYTFEQDINTLLEEGYLLHGEPNFTNVCNGFNSFGGRKYEILVSQILKKEE